MTDLNKVEQKSIDGGWFGLHGTEVEKLEICADKAVISAYTEYGIPEVCTECGSNLHKHSVKTVSLAHTPHNGLPSTVILKKARKKCPNCGKIYASTNLPFAVEGRTVTSTLLNHLIELSIDSTFVHVEKYCGVSDSTAQRVLEDYFDEMDQTHKFKLPYSLGLDEVKIGKTFRTTVTNLQKRTLVDILERRDGKFLIETFEKKYTESERVGVRWICTDMYRPFEKPLRQLFPNAEWVIDHFHVVRMANEAVDKIRRNLQNNLNDRRLAKGIKKRLRYILLKRAHSLTPEEEMKIKAVSLCVPEIGVAYGIKESFYDIYTCGTRDDAIKAFEDWELNLPGDSLYKDFADLAKTVRNFFDPIFRYWDSNGLTNGYTECANNLARVIDRRSRGLRFKLLRGKLLYNPRALKAGSIGGVEYGSSLKFVSLSTGEIFDNKPDDQETVQMTIPNLP